MPTYKNKLDGRIIETTSKASGADWEEYDPKAPAASKENDAADDDNVEDKKATAPKKTAKK